MVDDIGQQAVEEMSYYNGKFQDAHFVCWNKKATPKDYIIETDFKAANNYSLHMIMFSHLGLNGKEVFDASLDPRTGIAGQYTQGDLQGYRISYFHPERTTSNLRSSSPNTLLKTGPDRTDEYPDRTHKLRIIKADNKVTFEVSGEKMWTYTENDDSKVLPGGNWAFRLMNPAMGLYDNIKIYALDTTAVGIVTNNNLEDVLVNPYSFSDNIQVHSVTLMNVKGAIVCQQKVRQGDITVRIPFSSTPGIYLLRIAGDRETKIFKLLRAH